MKREYLAFAVISLLVLAPSALAQSNSGAIVADSTAQTRADSPGSNDSSPSHSDTPDQYYQKFMNSDFMAGKINPSDMKWHPKDLFAPTSAAIQIPSEGTGNSSNSVSSLSTTTPTVSAQVEEEPAPASVPGQGSFRKQNLTYDPSVGKDFRPRYEAAPTAPAAPVQQQATQPAAQPIAAAPAPAAPDEPEFYPTQAPSVNSGATAQVSSQQQQQNNSNQPLRQDDPNYDPASQNMAPAGQTQPGSETTEAVREVTQGLQVPEQQAPSSCVGYDKKGTESLYEKGASRLRKINNIIDEMNARSNDVRSAPAGSVNALKRKDATLPSDLEAKAKCMLILPNEMSGGFGGAELEYGAGAYKCRDASGNFEPTYHFVQLKGANLGFQLGGKVTDRVLFFMNDSAEQKLQHLDVKVGVRAGAAAGPWGRDGSLSTAWNLHDDIRSYSQSKGLYVGVSLEGAVIHPDKNMDAIMSGGAVGEHKHHLFGWLGFHHAFGFGHRNICEAASDQQGPNPAQGTGADVAPTASAQASSAQQ